MFHPAPFNQPTTIAGPPAGRPATPVLQEKGKLSKTLCKSVRKDGSPCQGRGLKKYDGLCITHGPAPDQVHEWRSLGGKNSATAARLDKRIPERLKDMIDLLDDGMKRLLDGTLSPARYTALCRGVKLKLDVYRQADQDMDFIRTEETLAAAAKFAGAHGDPDILAAADAITAKQDQYRAESLVAQGFAEFTKPTNPDIPPAVVLNDKGRRRFGYHDLDFTQQLLIEVNDQLDDFDGQQAALTVLPETTDLLETMKERVAQTQSRLAGDTTAPFDPLTGQPIAKLPTRVKIKLSRSRFNRCDESPPEVLAEQLSKIKELMRKTEELYEDEDFKPRWAAMMKHKKERKDLRVFLEAQRENGLLSTTPSAAEVGI